MNLEFALPIDFIIKLIGKYFAARVTPRARIYIRSQHDTFFISALNKNIIVFHKFEVTFGANSETFLIYNPFAGSYKSEADLEIDTICFGIGNEVLSPPFSEYSEYPTEIAFPTKFRFVKGKDYEIFAHAKYNNIKSYGDKRQFSNSGSDIEEHPFRLSYFLKTPIKRLIIELYFIDINLHMIPNIHEFEEQVLVGEAKDKFKRRSVLQNHFMWINDKPSLGKRYEISWRMPDKEALCQRGLNLGYHQIANRLGVFTKFLSDAVLVEPWAALEIRQNVIDFCSKAKKRIVIVDPFIDISILDFIDKCPNEIQVIFITRRNASKQLNMARVKAYIEYKGFQLLVQDVYDIHDRFIIIDDRFVLSVGSSLKDIALKLTIIMPLSEYGKLTRTIITAIYSHCGIEFYE